MRKCIQMLSVALTAATLTAPALADSEFVAGPGAYETVPEFAPVIGFMDPRMEFGVVDQGDVLEHEFDFLNNGNAPLTLKSAKSETSGVSVAISSAPISAGETGKVWVKFNTSWSDGDTPIRVHVESNAHNGASTLYLHAHVQGPEK